MISVWLGGKTTTNGAGNTQYSSPQGVSPTSYDATEDDVSCPMPTSGTIKKMFYRRNTAPGAGDTATLTLMKNGVATALTCTMSGDTDKTASDESNEISVSAGDLVSVRLTSNGGASTTNNYWTLYFEGDTANESVWLGANTATQGGTDYHCVMAASNGDSNSTDRTIVIPTAGTVKKLYVYTSANQTAGTTAVTVMRGTSPSSVSATSIIATLTTTAQAANDTVNTQAFSVADSVCLRTVSSGAQAIHTRFGVVFVADTDDESILGFSTDNSYHTTNTEYNSFTGTDTTWNGTAGNNTLASYFGLPDGWTATIDNFYVHCDAPGAGNTIDFSLYEEIDGVTALTTQIGETDREGNDTANDITVVHEDDFSWQSVPGGGPAVGDYRCGVRLVIIAPETGTNLQINIGDVWKLIPAMQLNIGDAWKVVAGVQENIGDAWKVVF